MKSFLTGKNVPCISPNFHDNWAYQWKMSFNLDPSKQAQEVIFSRQIKKPSHSDLIFNNNEVIQTPHQSTSVYF